MGKLSACAMASISPLLPTAENLPSGETTNASAHGARLLIVKTRPLMKAVLFPGEVEESIRDILSLVQYRHPRNLPVV
jgi:hypothetical protein